MFSFVRWSDAEQLIVVSNFSNEEQGLEVGLPEEAVSRWSLADGRYPLREQLYGLNNSELLVENGLGHTSITLAPLESVVYRIGELLQ